MGPMARVSLLTLVVGIAPCVTIDEIANAQQPAIKRTELLKTDLAGMEGKEMNLWTADLAPRAQTGKHHHPTPRFVIVLEGSVVLEMEGQPPQTFKANQAFQEPPDVVHNSGMRVRQSWLKLLESSMREKDSLSRWMTARVSQCLL